MRIRFWKSILFVFFFCFLAAAFYFFNLRIFLADYYYNRTLLTEDWPEVLAAYQKVFLFQPAEPFYHQQFALDLDWGLKFYQSDESKMKVLDLAVSQMEKIEERERSYSVAIYLARLLAHRADLSRVQGDFAKAEQAFVQAAMLAPQMARVYTDWCQLKVYEQEWEQAREMCQRAFHLYPPLDHPQMNQEHRGLVAVEMVGLYENLGEIYVNLGDYDKAESMYRQILKFVPLSRPDIWKKWGDVYYLQGDLDGAIEKNFHGYTLKPRDPFWSLTLALLYRGEGDEESARFWAENILRLDPGNKQAKTLLDKLGV